MSTPLQPTIVYVPVDGEGAFSIQTWEPSEAEFNHVQNANKESVFIFDRAALVKLLGDAFDAGQSHVKEQAYIFPDKEQYIKSLNLK